MFDGERIYLRLLELQDLPLRVKWVNDPEVRRTLMFDYPLSLARTQAWFNKTLMDETRRDFSIVRQGSDKVIGMTGLIQIDVKHRKAQFYITIGEKEFWGQRIADEVIAIILHYGFSELNLNRIYLYTIPSNERARKLYERHGFVPEGILREDYYCVGKSQDVHVHSILRREWIAIKDKLCVRFEQKTQEPPNRTEFHTGNAR
jgi:diamine N-acetyltransferase